MLARKNRVSKAEFPTPRSKGVRFVSLLFSGILYPTGKSTKFSVVVSKKTARTAVSRNLIRRRFYSAVGPLLKEIKTAALVVFYPKIEAAKTSFVELEKEIKNVFIKNSLL
jgi:ribonuclease P protein component